MPGAVKVIDLHCHSKVWNRSEIALFLREIHYFFSIKMTLD